MEKPKALVPLIALFLALFVVIDCVPVKMLALLTANILNPVYDFLEKKRWAKKRQKPPLSQIGNLCLL